METVRKSKRKFPDLKDKQVGPNWRQIKKFLFKISRRGVLRKDFDCWREWGGEGGLNFFFDNETVSISLKTTPSPLDSLMNGRKLTFTIIVVPKVFDSSPTRVSKPAVGGTDLTGLLPVAPAV